MYFLIWSFEHSSWWRPNRHGYTRFIAEAGRYSPEEAMEIAANANRFGRIHEAVVPIFEGEYMDLPENVA